MSDGSWRKRMSGLPGHPLSPLGPARGVKLHRGEKGFKSPFALEAPSSTPPAGYREDWALCYISGFGGSCLQRRFRAFDPLPPASAFSSSPAVSVAVLPPTSPSSSKERWMPGKQDAYTASNKTTGANVLLPDRLTGRTGLQGISPKPENICKRTWSLFLAIGKADSRNVLKK